MHTDNEMIKNLTQNNSSLNCLVESLSKYHSSSIVWVKSAGIQLGKVPDSMTAVLTATSLGIEFHPAVELDSYCIA